MPREREEIKGIIKDIGMILEVVVKFVVLIVHRTITFRKCVCKDIGQKLQGGNSE